MRNDIEQWAVPHSTQNARSELAFFFRSAELAIAAYANLQVGATASPVNLEALAGPGGVGMSAVRAMQFARRFPAVVLRFDDAAAPEGMGTRFSATAFQYCETRELTLAFRGCGESPCSPVRSTAPDCGDHSGATSHAQAVAMTNWWLRVITPRGQSVRQFRLVAVPGDRVYTDITVLAGSASTGGAYMVDVAPPAEGMGLIAGDVQVDVTGHGLGGCLASAFSTIFADHTGEVTVFEAPRFHNGAANQAFFRTLGGTVPVAI